MLKFKVGDKVSMNPTSRWVRQGFDKDGTPFIGRVVESTHGHYQYCVEWNYNSLHKRYYYNDQDLLPISYQTNEEAAFLLRRNKAI